APPLPDGSDVRPVALGPDRHLLREWRAPGEHDPRAATVPHGPGSRPLKATGGPLPVGSCMGAFFVLGMVVAICVLSLVYGVDSRIWDDRDRRGWWPGGTRRPNGARQRG